ncbi:MAG: hypothetical protein LBE56_11095, partial [Tannerella sp.]|nr:hypothetical protein [Tannerella sp.]
DSDDRRTNLDAVLLGPRIFLFLPRLFLHLKVNVWLSAGEAMARMDTNFTNAFTSFFMGKKTTGTSIIRIKRKFNDIADIIFS